MYSVYTIQLRSITIQHTVYILKSSNVHLSPYYQTIRGQVSGPSPAYRSGRKRRFQSIFNIFINRKKLHTLQLLTSSVYELQWSRIKIATTPQFGTFFPPKKGSLIFKIQKNGWPHKFICPKDSKKVNTFEIGSLEVYPPSFISVSPFLPFFYKKQKTKRCFSPPPSSLLASSVYPLFSHFLEETENKTLFFLTLTVVYTCFFSF